MVVANAPRDQDQEIKDLKELVHSLQSDVRSLQTKVPIPPVSAAKPRHKVVPAKDSWKESPPFGASKMPRIEGGVTRMPGLTVGASDVVSLYTPTWYIVASQAILMPLSK